MSARGCGPELPAGAWTWPAGCPTPPSRPASTPAPSPWEYANVLAVKEGSEDNAAIQALVEALHSDTVREYIESTYSGAVVPLF